MSNIVTAAFQDGEQYCRVRNVWQYDHGQVLRIQGLTLPPAVEIHFSLTDAGGESITRVGVTKDNVTDVIIPDSLLENDNVAENYNIYAYIYLTEPGSGETEYKITISVKTRPRPENTGSTTWEEILKAVNQIASEKADSLSYKDNILKLMSGEKELSRVTIVAGSGSGSDAREIELQKSSTALQWRYTGDETWNDLVTLAEITGAQGEQGIPGPKGETGTQGEQGPAGPAGEPGKDGRGITSATIKENGHLEINYSDGTNADVGNVVGNEKETGWTNTQANLLKKILQAIKFYDTDVSSDIITLCNSIGTRTDTDNTPSEITFSQSGSCLTVNGITSVASITQSGSTLIIT